MPTLIFKRIFWMIPTLLLISLMSFAIIQLPPGDYLTAYIATLEEQEATVVSASPPRPLSDSPESDPPQRLHMISDDGLHLWPFVYALKGARHPETLQRLYVEDRSRTYPLRLFARGETYRFWGTFETDLHLFGVDPGATIFLLGADSLGRDLFSRIIYGAQG